MKTIKFRAWDFNSKSWYVPTEYEVSEGARLFFAVDKEIIKFNRGDMELMQFTGLLDKNGKEIYEGDYLKQEGLYVEVKWGVFEAGFIFEDGSGSLMTVTSGNSNMWEVIGSIYENPELLED